MSYVKETVLAKQQCQNNSQQGEMEIIWNDFSQITIKQDLFEPSWQWLLTTTDYTAI